ncbi:hypothetical protein Golomagni_05445 [Golovinomyces magnicellulatus]|nr:hypothetical protein Golomagni_05445 [Golovinomyces magnicellulatus]
MAATTNSTIDFEVSTDPFTRSFHLPATTLPVSQSTPNRRPPNARWTDVDIESMLQQLRLAKDEGNTSEGGFKCSVWTAIAHSFADPAKTSRSCETKFARLKKDYQSVKWLREASVFGWDNETCLVTAELSVWEALIKAIIINLESIFLLATVGKYRIYGSILEGEEVDASGPDSDSDEAIYARSRTSAYSTPSFESNVIDSASVTTETRTQKRHRESASALKPEKRQRVSGIGILGKMVEGTMAIADAMVAESSTNSIIKENAQSSLQGQAQARNVTLELAPI